MMDKKKIWIIAFFSILLLSLFLRYPDTPHQRLFDSPDYHLLANLLIEDGKPQGIVHPVLSNMGLSPLSGSPRGGIYFLSSISLLSSLSIENSILLMNFSWSLLLCFSSFLLGYKVFQDEKLALFTAFFFMSAGVVIGYTKFTAVMRGFPTAFLPFLFLLLFSLYKKERSVFELDRRFLFLLVITFFSIFITHRLTYFFLLIIGGYLVYINFQYPFIKITMKIKRYIDEFKYPRLVKFFLYSSVLVLMIAFSLLFFRNFFGKTTFLTSSAILSGDNISIKTFNVFYLIARKMSAGFIFALFGFIVLSMEEKNFFESYCFVGLLVLAPFSIRRSYIFPVWMVLLSLFAAFGLYKFLNFLKNWRLNKKIVPLIMIFILIGIVFAPILITIEEPYIPERKRKTYVTDEEIETAVYLRENLPKEDSFYVDPPFNGNTLSAFSNRNNLAMEGQEYLVINDSIKNEIQYEFADDFYGSRGSLYSIKRDPLFPEENFWHERHKEWFRKYYNESQHMSIVKFYNIELIVLDEHFVKDYEYLVDLADTGYKIYNTERYVAYPPST